MSRKVLIQSYQPDPSGPTYGRIVQPDEMIKLQDLAHSHIEEVVRDLLMKNAPASLVAGFAYTLTGGMNISIAAGQAIDASGLSYDTLPAGQASAVVIPASHPSLPRIDLILATLASNQDSENQPLPHRRLRTQLELESGVPEYTPLNYNVPTERQNRATVVVRQGTANASPIAPTAGANEVALFTVRVEAGVTSITSDKVTDVRTLMRSLRDAWVQIDANTAALTSSVLNEVIEDLIGSFMAVTPNTGLSKVYDDPGNALTLAGVAATDSVMGMMSAADKTKLDQATASDVASTLALRDSSGNVRHNEVRVDAGVRYMADGSFKRSAFVREDFYNLIEVNTPVGYHSSSTGVYGNVLRVPMASVPNSATSTPSVNVAPLFDLWVDPADFAGMNCTFEAYALHAGPQPPVNGQGLWDTDIQLWNATDGVELARLNYTWLNTNYIQRSGLFTLTGTGVKHLLIRARHNTDNTNVIFQIWRARLIVNPSF